tara:strand:- start:890 stop:1717 length:828 start_codon:yes stop_codon:yes gene_type:complete
MIYTKTQLYEKIQYNLEQMTDDEVYSMYCNTNHILKTPRSDIILSNKISILLTPLISFINANTLEFEERYLSELSSLHKQNIKKYISLYGYQIINTIFNIEKYKRERILKLYLLQKKVSLNINIELKLKGNNIIIEFEKVKPSNYILEELKHDKIQLINLLKQSNNLYSFEKFYKLLITINHKYNLNIELLKLQEYDMNNLNEIITEFIEIINNIEEINDVFTFYEIEAIKNIIEVDNEMWKFNDLFKITNQVKDIKLTDEEMYIIDFSLEKIKN